MWCSWTGERRGRGRSGTEAQARARSKRDPGNSRNKSRLSLGKRVAFQGFRSRGMIIHLCLKQGPAEEWSQYLREQKGISGILMQGLGITLEIVGAVCGRRSRKKRNL